MARDVGRDKEADEDEETPKAVKKKSDFVRLVIPGAIAIFIAVLGAQVAAPLLTQMIAGEPGAAGEQRGNEEDEEEYFDDELPGNVVAAIAPAIYVPLDPPLVVSFADKDAGTRFLQLTLQAMARDQRSIDAVKQHSPALRNAFLFLLSGRSVDDLMSLAGKEALRAEMTAKAQEILEINTGKPGIEELYFTSFVVQ
jgi:flagellar FliL protein